MRDYTKWIKELIEADNVSEFYRCRAWRRARAECFAAYHYECQECKRNGKLTILAHPGRELREGEVKGIAHHKKPLRLYPELAFSQDNLEPECWACHNRIEKQDESGIVTPEFW